MEKPCSRVLRKLSGELTIIQYCAARPPLDLRLRRERPVLAGLPGSVGVVSALSDTDRRLLAVDAGRTDRAQVFRLRNQSAQVSYLSHVSHLVLGDPAAGVVQAPLAG